MNITNELSEAIKTANGRTYQFDLCNTSLDELQKAMGQTRDIIDLGTQMLRSLSNQIAEKTAVAWAIVMTLFDSQTVSILPLSMVEGAKTYIPFRDNSLAGNFLYLELTDGKQFLNYGTEDSPAVRMSITNIKKAGPFERDHAYLIMVHATREEAVENISYLANCRIANLRGRS